MQQTTPQPNAEGAARLSVTFQSKGRTQRKWTEHFELGSHEANSLKALDVAWKKNAAIVASVEAA